MAKSKFYVVWTGIHPGIYKSWEECKLQVEGYVGARYKSYASLDIAEAAYAAGPPAFNEVNHHLEHLDCEHKPEMFSICVDAAVNARTHFMEYQGVWTEGRDRIFHFGPIKVFSINVGEFLAIVHALAWQKNNNINLPVYSDSRNAIGWAERGRVNTKIDPADSDERIPGMIKRAEIWLEKNPVHAEVRKWETKTWGENPADFNRK